MNSSALALKDCNTKSYVLLKLREYVRGMKGRELSDYECSEPYRTLLPLYFSNIEAEEAEQVARTWEKF